MTACVYEYAWNITYYDLLSVRSRKCFTLFLLRKDNCKLYILTLYFCPYISFFEIFLQDRKFLLVNRIRYKKDLHWTIICDNELLNVQSKLVRLFWRLSLMFNEIRIYKGFIILQIQHVLHILRITLYIFSDEFYTYSSFYSETRITLKGTMKQGHVTSLFQRLRRIISDHPLYSSITISEQIEDIFNDDMLER